MTLADHTTFDPNALSCCHGFEVRAEDGPVGQVETPLFPPDGWHPDYLVVRVAGADRTVFPAVHTSLVRRVDAAGRWVHVGLRRADLVALPEHLPLIGFPG